MPPNGRSSPVIGDIDGNGVFDVLAAAEDGYLRAYRGDSGQALPGFPLWIEPSWSAPLLTDIEGDGLLDLAAFGWGSHKLYVWSLPGLTFDRSIEWSRLGGDPGRTGCYLPADAKTNSLNGRASSPSTSTADTFLLESCLPNPFRDKIAFNFRLASAGEIRLKIYNPLGQLVRTISSGPLAAGKHRIFWDGRNEKGIRVSQGSYYCRLCSGLYREIRKIVFID